MAVLLAALSLGSLSFRVSGQEPVVFRSGVDLVRLDIRVVDAAGRPITDLRPEEITITERGQTRPALFFQRVTEPTETYVDAAMRAVTAEVTSNDAFPRGHLYILIFDQAHITPGNEQRARLAAEAFIRQRVRPSDRVAIHAVPGPGPRLGFTADRTRAIEALSGIRGSYQRVVTTVFGTMGLFEAHRILQGDEKLIMDTFDRLTREGGGDLLGISMGAAGAGRGGGAGEDMTTARRLLTENARTIVNQSDAESRQFLQRLADVIVGLGDIEGRKSVVLFSEGFFQDNLARELEAVAAAAAQTYSVFYTFDLNQRGPPVNEAYASNTTLATEIQSRIAPLGTLAVETDGMMVLDASGRSGEALNQMADQAQDYYLVGFTPSDDARAQRGQYQRVTVTVSRPGARVSARTGYSLRADATPADRQRSINTVLGAPFVQQGLQVDYTTYVLKSDQPGHQRVVLSLAAQLPVQSTPGAYADVVFVARDLRDGRVVASGTDTIALPEAARAGAALGTGHWRVQFSVPAGQYLMRTVVREPGGLVGSADRRLDVRPLDSPDVSVSDLVLGSAVSALPVRAVALSGDGLSGVIEAYARAEHQLEGLTLTVALRTPDGRESRASYDMPLSDAVPGGTGYVSRSPFTLPLTGVPAGPYIVHATIHARGGLVAERTRYLEVADGVSVAVPIPPAPRVSPIEMVEGALGQAYVAALLQHAQGTVWAAAAEEAGRGEWERVEAAVQRPEADRGFVPNALKGLARFIREDFSGAAAALTEAQRDERDHALTAFFLGWAQDQAGDTRAALTAWRGAAHLDPSLVSAHLALAEGYLKLREPALAIQALRAGLAALPGSPELRLKLQQIEGR